VSFGPALTACADLSGEIPAEPIARLDRVERALASLRDERRRLERLGLELPLVRCEAQYRYWKFLGAMAAIESAERR
jgi:hypothetical protein